MLLYPEARAQSRRDHQGAATLKRIQKDTHPRTEGIAPRYVRRRLFARYDTDILGINLRTEPLIVYREWVWL